MRRPRELACVAAVVTLGILLMATPAPADDLVYIPLDHWSYEAFARLATLGLVPLHAVSARPITRREARRLVQVASATLREASPRIAGLARDDLQRLTQEFSTRATAEVTGGALVGGWSTDFVPHRDRGASSISLTYTPGDRFVIQARAVGPPQLGDSPRHELYASFQLGTVLVQAGRTSLAWGPSGRSSLHLSDNAGTFPLIRLTADLPRARLTKVVASLERSGGTPPGGVLLFGTRLDWLVTPRFRLGFNETVVTTWGPLGFFHLIQPLPVFSASVASYDLHDALGQSRNISVSVDGDWIPVLGIRLYGVAFVDDAPEAIAARRARVGALAGIYLLDPFRTGRTSLRLEYSAVTNGTYGYGPDEALSHTFQGRSLGHWLGPDGDDLYLELTHRLNPETTLQAFYAMTRHGQGRIGQPGPGPDDWFLTGVVERRHTVGVQLHKIHNPAFETRYRVELASVTNQRNVTGVRATEGILSFDFTYRWLADGMPISFDQPITQLPEPRSVVSLTEPGRITLRSWSSTMTSRGTQSGPAVSATSLGVGYRIPIGSIGLALAYDRASGGDQVFWSADLNYPIGQFEHGRVAIFAGYGGLRFRGTFGGTDRTITSSAFRVGAEFYYRLTLQNTVTPLYFTGQISSSVLGPGKGPDGLRFSSWTYSLAAGWHLRSGLSFEAGYRGATVRWGETRLFNETFLQWDGLYLALAMR